MVAFSTFHAAPGLSAAAAAATDRPRRAGAAAPASLPDSAYSEASPGRSRLDKSFPEAPSGSAGAAAEAGAAEGSAAAADRAAAEAAAELAASPAIPAPRATITSRTAALTAARACASVSKSNPTRAAIASSAALAEPSVSAKNFAAMARLAIANTIAATANDDVPATTAASQPPTQPAAAAAAVAGAHCANRAHTRISVSLDIDQPRSAKLRRTFTRPLRRARPPTSRTPATQLQ